MHGDTYSSHENMAEQLHNNYVSNISNSDINLATSFVEMLQLKGGTDSSNYFMILFAS